MKPITFFFNRFSIAARTAEALGVILSLPAALMLLKSGAKAFAWYAFIFELLAYAFVRFCASRRWYSDAPKYSGIELQFLKALIPCGYILFIAHVWAIAFPSAVPFVVSGLLIAFLAHVNVILIYFHFKDKDKTPVNFYSSRKFLKH